MNTDELIRLTEALTGDITIDSLRAGTHSHLDGLQASDWALLVRFLGGERPEVVREWNPSERHLRQTVVDEGPSWDEPPPARERPERPKHFKKVGEQDQDGRLVLTSEEFDGVTLL